MERAALKTHKSRNVTSILIVNLVMVLIAMTITTRTSALTELAAKPQQATAQDSRPSDVRELKMGEPIERELSGSATHSYGVSLTQGQYLKVVVDQKGIDVIIRVFAPDGQKLREVNETPAAVLESTFLIAEAAGMYRVEVESSSKDAKSGTYEIRIKDLRESTSKDRIQVSAQKIFDEANKLRDQQTAESRGKAIQKYEEALPLWREAGDRYGEANTLDQIGLIYSQLAENLKALDYFGQALPLYRSGENRQRQASTLNNIGDVHYQMGAMQKALEYHNQALPLSRAVGDRQEEATTLSNVGRVYFKLGEPHRALEYFAQVFSLTRGLGYTRREAIALVNMGAVYDSLGEYRKALEYYGQALPLLRLVGDSREEGVVLNNMGVAYAQLGELPKALKTYSQSLTLARVTGNRYSESSTLDNMGNVYDLLSEPQKALQSFHQALEIKRAIANRTGQAATLHNIGVIYMFVGELQRALEYFDQSLSLRRELKDRRGEAAVLDSIGGVYYSLGEFRKALDYHNQSLSLRRAVGDPRGESSALSNIGMAYNRLGELQKALEYLDHALRLRRNIGFRSGEASTLHNIGRIYSKLAEADKALEYYAQALELSQAVGYRSEEAAILLSTARERARDNMVEARRQVDDALSIIESTRAKLTSQDLRTSFAASKQDYYEFYVDLLMKLHQVQPSGKYDWAAFGASERARARSLLELLAEARIDVKQGIAPDLKQREKDVQSRISRTQNRLIQASSLAKPDRTKVAALEEELKKLESEREQVEVEIRQKHPRYATLHYPSPLDLKAVQKLLGEKTVLLAYSLGQEASYLFAITQKDFLTARLPSASVIAPHVTALREAVAVKPDRIALSNYFQKSRSLYQDLIQPAHRLLKGKRALIIVPDGILHYLPFEALLQTDSGPKSQVDLRQLPYMVRNYTISYAPSATVLANLRNDRGTRAPGKTLLAFGDPIYEEKESEQTSSVRSALNSAFGESKPWELRQLPESRREVEGIAKLYSPSEVTVFLGEQAKEENLKVEGRPGSYRFVHFAVHGLLNENQPQYSGLVLSLSRSKKEKATPTSDSTAQNPGVNGSAVAEDGLLQVYEIFNLRLDADLVVLSACETGLGKATKGEGIVGMTQAFLYAGTPSVAVSLWKVQDRSTSDLMVRLYRHLNNSRLNRADALRQAQLEMIRKGDFSHPYYWAGFVLIGRP